MSSVRLLYLKREWMYFGRHIAFCRTSYSDLSVLDWYTPLASQSSHLGTASLYYLADISSGSLLSPSFLALSVLSSFFCFVCLRVLRARPRERARRRRGCQRVLASRGGVARSAVAAFVPRRRVCLETRGMHEWALSRLHL